MSTDLGETQRGFSLMAGAARNLHADTVPDHPDHLDSGITGWWWQGMCIEGSPESEIHRDSAPLPSEKVVLKHRYSAFYNKTESLETILRRRKIEGLVITGIMTNMCCESTARDAIFQGLPRSSFLPTAPWKH